MMRSIALALLVQSALLIPRAAAEEPRLAGVEVRGNKRVETDAIRLAIRSQTNEPISRERVAADIKAIFALGLFTDVRAEVEQTATGALLVFIVTEKPSIASVDFRGNEEIGNDKVKEVVDIKPLSVLDVAQIRKNAEKIHELYVEKGYFLAEVTHELRDQPNNSVALTFVVNEHAKIEVRRINFLGNQKLRDKELSEVMETREGGFFSFLTSWGTYKEAALERDQLRLAELYYNNGYLNVKVSEPIVEISPDRRYLYLTIPISEGEQFHVGAVAFSGDLMVEDSALLSAIDRALADEAATLPISDALASKLKARFKSEEIAGLKVRLLEELERGVSARRDRGDPPDAPLDSAKQGELEAALQAELLSGLQIQVLKSMLDFKTGEIFSKMKLGMSLFRIRDKYKDRGYAYADVIPETHIDSATRIIGLTLNVQRGAKVFVERIDVEGNDKTRDKVIRRQLRVYEGEYYSGQGLDKSRRLINGLGFFEKVEVTEKRGSGADRIVITVSVKERQTGTFQIGAGFSSVENFIATAQISQQNLFGRGQTLSFMAQLSSLRQFFSIQFVEPYFLDTKWYLALSGYNTQLDYIDFLRKASGGRMTLGYWFWDDWRVSFTYALEKVDVSAGRGTSAGLRDNNLFNDGWTSSVEASLLWDTRDDRIFPTDGWYFQTSSEWASPYTLSENHFLRLSGVGRYYYPIFWGLVLKTNLTVGYMISTSEKPLPIFEKYFVGGIYTVRGYQPRSIGPTKRTACDGFDPASPACPTNYGGNKEFIINLELEFPIFPQVNIKGVLFVDAGNAYGEGEPFFSERYNVDGSKQTYWGMYWSTGFGFRWFSPIGPLRFEWGIPLTRRPSDRDILFEFTIGNLF